MTHPGHGASRKGSIAAISSNKGHMNLSKTVLISLLTMFVMVMGGTASAEQGSSILLHGLWSEAELAGTPADHLVTRPYSKPADLSPPDRVQPLVQPAATPQRLRGVIRRVKIADGEKVLALTFDLCERASNRTGYRTEIVNHLRRRGVAATLFAGGKWMRSHPVQTMQLMADPLFELGNHSWTHANLALMDKKETREQVLWTQGQYEILREKLALLAGSRGLEAQMSHVPESMAVFRLPYGRNSAATLDYLARMGLPVVQWDVLGDHGHADQLRHGWLDDPDSGCGRHPGVQRGHDHDRPAHHSPNCIFELLLSNQVLENNSTSLILSSTFFHLSTIPPN